MRNKESVNKNNTNLTPDKDDNTYALALCILFALLIIIGFMSVQTQEPKQPADTTTVQQYNINQQIDSMRGAIDSLRHTKQKHINDKLMQIPEYQYVQQHQARIDSLVNVNKQLLNRAYNAATNYSVMTIVPYNAKVFQDYQHIPAVQQSSWPYYKNNKEIKTFNQQKNRANQIAPGVRLQAETEIINKIDSALVRLDSLLNEKNNLLTQKSR